MEHTNDHGVYGRPHPEQQQRRSSRIIRHVMLFLIVTLTTIVLTSSCASADSPIHATTVLVGSVPGESSARQELTALVPDAVDSPLRIVLRSEDLIKIPCGMARETSVQLVNSVSNYHFISSDECFTSTCASLINQKCACTDFSALLLIIIA